MSMLLNPFVVVPPSPPATWNPADKAAEIALSGGNLIAKRSGITVTDYVNVRADHVITGKKYWEIKIDDGGLYYIMGVMDASGSLSSYVGSDVHGWGYANNDGALYHNGVQQIAPGVLPTATAAGTVFQFAYDTGDNKLYIGINGTWMNMGDPALSSGQVTICSGTLYPALGMYTLENLKTTTAAFSGGFTYTPPSGYSGF